MKFNANKFKELRLKSGYTQKQMAVILNTKQNTISTWESSFRSPSKITMYEIAKRLNVNVSQLADFEEEVNKDNNLNPLEEILLRKFRKMDKSEQIFLLETNKSKHQALLDEIEEYKNIIKNLSEHLDSRTG